MSSETLTHLSQLQGTERRVALATLVAAKGNTPKKEGAKMWVGDGGRVLGSVTIGGCVDARVLAESERVLAAGGAPTLLTMSLGDEDAWDLGLTCGGTVQVLIEPVDLARDDDPLVAAYNAVRREVDAGRRAVLVTPLDGSAARLVVRDDGTVAGTLGGVGPEAAAQAADVLARGVSRVAPLGAGAPDAFYEVYGPPVTMVVFGAGHVAMHVVAIARELGWRSVVVDGRERFATRERFPAADELRVGMVSEIAEQLTYGANTFVVLVAHDYKYDIPVLRTVLRQEVAYVGLLGGRKRGQAILDFLAEEGVAPETLARVHTPIGLDIGAQTAAEIALSIVAEACAAKARRAGTPLRSPAAERGPDAGARAGPARELAAGRP
jgi:xanthine dehydrogenase accessory factor